MNLSKIERLVSVQTELIRNQRDSKMDSMYEVSYAINEVSKAIKAELLKPDDEEAHAL